MPSTCLERDRNTLMKSRDACRLERCHGRSPIAVLRRPVSSILSLLPYPRPGLSALHLLLDFPWCCVSVLGPPPKWRLCGIHMRPAATKTPGVHSVSGSCLAVTTRSIVFGVSNIPRSANLKSALAFVFVALQQLPLFAWFCS